MQSRQFHARSSSPEKGEGALSDCVATHLSQAKVTTANAYVLAISRQEVRDTMWAIQDVGVVMIPVVSDIPALIFQPALGTQTPLPLGRRALETLENGIPLEWPSDGHVMAGNSVDGCAGAIAASFVDHPMSEPNATC